MKCEIIAIGSEVVAGDIINTNAADIANFLKNYGVQTIRHTAVLDDKSTIVKAINEAFGRAELVITTGGLGPTYDDISKESVAEVFGLPMEKDEESLKKIEDFFKKLGRKMTDNNIKQAYFPMGSTIIKNNNGTAPGCITEKNGKTVIMLPGPPIEALPMLNSVTMKDFLTKNQTEVIYENTLRVMGIGEAILEIMLSEYMKEGQNPLLAPYAKTGEVHLKITARASSYDEAKEIADELKVKIYSIIGDNIYAENKDGLEKTAVRLLGEKEFKISTAEFFTGGLLASSINSAPNSKNVYSYGIVGWAEEVANAEAAANIANDVKKTAKTDVGISIIGSGENGFEKLIYVGLSINNKTFTKEFNFLGNIDKIKDLAVKNALLFLIEHLKK